MARVVVLGAGVVGVTTAYYLGQAGHEVTVVERQPAAGLETSFANAGLLTPGHAVPLAGPGVPWKTLKWLGRVDAPLRFRLFADPAQWRWLLAFLGNCTHARFDANTRRLAALALYSNALLAQLRERTGIQYDGAAAGLLHIFDNEHAYRAALPHARFMSELGVSQLPVTRAECLSLEPALEASRQPIVGGIHTPGDESGDAMRFSQALAGLAAQGGVTFRHGCTVQELVHDGTRITVVHTDQGPLQADWVVLSLGSYSTAMARPLGLRLPVHPVKGYSVTIPVEPDAPAPRMSLYDEAHKIGISRLGDRLRAGGTAEFARFDTSIDPRRAHALEQAVEALVPTGLRRAETSRWAGLRPMTPDGMPLLGRTSIANLLLNTGHGTLGWTLACASGQVMADLIEGRAPEVDAEGFSLDRF